MHLGEHAKCRNVHSSIKEKHLRRQMPPAKSLQTEILLLGLLDLQQKKHPPPLRRTELIKRKLRSLLEPKNATPPPSFPHQGPRLQQCGMQLEQMCGHAREK